MRRKGILRHVAVGHRGSIMKSSSTESADHSPIDDFSQCHAGILGQLQALGTLPALLEPAARARQIAADTVSFFRDAVFEHHAEEESELFPAVLASATKGAERDKVQAIVAELTAEHRQVEAAWSKLEPKLKAVAKGHEAELDGAEITALVLSYQAHARYEEEVFLPLSQSILGRNSNHMAALGISMHMRHAMPEAMQRFAGRI
jgi:hemerythrin-like domain-containing protein